MKWSELEKGDLLIPKPGTGERVYLILERSPSSLRGLDLGSGLVEDWGLVEDHAVFLWEVTRA